MAGKRRFSLKIKDDAIVTVQERDIAEIKIIEYTVMREAFSQLNQEAIAFLYKEFSLTEKEFLAITEDDLVCMISCAILNTQRHLVMILH